MQKQAPSIGRILIAAAFTLSCFGLILFLWIAFGGPVPLKPQSYRVTAYFPEATQLAAESDVRIGGVSVGKVKTVEAAPPDLRVHGNDVTAAELEIQPKYAPISTDARAILRQKTLLGETYIELTAGTEPSDSGEPTAQVALGEAVELPEGAVPAEALPEGGSLGVGRTREATQIDEIFNALDTETRESFQRWQASSAIAIRDRGLDLNDALGNLAPFITDASDTLDILARQEEALRGVVRDTGITFEALSERRDELTGAIRGSRNTFAGLAAEEQALADTFKILPTFERESTATLERLDEFQVQANPLLEELIPAARELTPALASIRELAPDLRDLFVDLDPFQRSAMRGLPALRDFLDGLAPVIDELDHFLADLNPVIRYLEYQKATVADFLAGPGAGLSGAVDGLPGDPAPRHYLRQLSMTGTDTLALWPVRLATNRGHGYLADGTLNGYQVAKKGIFPNFDCKNTDYTPVTQDPDEDEIVKGQSVDGINMGNPPDARFAPCWVQDPFRGMGGDRAPLIYTDP